MKTKNKSKRSKLKWLNSLKGRNLVFVAVFAVIGVVILARSFASVPVLQGSDGEIVDITPARILDTRSAIGIGSKTPLRSNSAVSIQINGTGTIPANNVKSVIINVTAVSPASAGYLTVWQTGVNRPTTSSVNFAAGQTLSNQIIVPVGADGKVQLFTSASSHVLFDVSGYVSAASGVKGNRFEEVTPSRVLDTRNAQGITTRTALPAGKTVTVQMTSAGTIPANNVKSVIINVTAVSPASAGYLTVWQTGVNRPTTSSVNFAAGQTLSNQIIVPVGADGKVQLFTSASSHVLFDVSGYLTDRFRVLPSSQNGRFVPLTPNRILDTRNAIGISSKTQLTNNRQIAVQVNGKGGVPSRGVRAVTLNATAVAPASAGYLTVWPTRLAQPTTSSVNFAAGQTLSNQIIVPVGADGKVQLFTSASSHVLFDVSGYFIEGDISGEEAGSLQRFPGDPNPRITGLTYLGADELETTTYKSRFENATGKSVSIARRFYDWNQHAQMITDVKDDKANNRLSFVSTKTPGWVAVAAGQHDAALDDMLRKLDATGGPVWLAVHHEPDGGCHEECVKPNYTDEAGGPKAWLDMQVRVRQRMKALNTKNIAFMAILTGGFSETSIDKGLTMDSWWVDNTWDAYFIDYYKETHPGAMADHNYWKKFVSWIENKGLPYGTAEFGIRSGGQPGVGYYLPTNNCYAPLVPRGVSSSLDVTSAKILSDFWNWGFINRKDIVAHAYFDKCVNSEGSPWALGGSQLNTFRQILKDDHRIQRLDTLR